MQTKSIQSNIAKIANNKQFINKLKKFQKLIFLFGNAIHSIYRFFQHYQYRDMFGMKHLQGFATFLFVAVSPIIVSSAIFVHLFYDMEAIWLSMSQNMKLLQRNTIIKALLSKLWNFEHPKLDLLISSLNKFLKGIHICLTYFFVAKYIFCFCTNSKLSSYKQSKYSFILNILNQIY